MDTVAVAQGEYMQAQAQADTYEDAVARAMDLLNGVVLGRVYLTEAACDKGDWYVFNVSGQVSPGGQQVGMLVTFRQYESHA